MFSIVLRHAPASCSPWADESRRPRGRLVLVREWLRRSRERGELAAMEDREWRDIGLTRADVMRETGKPFWR